MGGTVARAPDVGFLEAWGQLRESRRARRLLVGVAMGAAGFGMQDVLLEPYGGEVMGLSVGTTSMLTALTALGAVLALSAAASKRLRIVDPHRLAASGALVGAFSILLITIAAPAGAPILLQGGTTLLGFGGGLFAVGTIIACMEVPRRGEAGLILGAWGAVYATSAGVAIGFGGAIRDLFAEHLSLSLGPGLPGTVAGYAVVYQFEILALFLAAATLGPLVRGGASRESKTSTPFGLGGIPG